MRVCAIVVVALLATAAGSASVAPESIVYVRQDPRGVDLWLARLDGHAHLLVGGQGEDDSPTWSSDGG